MCVHVDTIDISMDPISVRSPLSAEGICQFHVPVASALLDLPPSFQSSRGPSAALTPSLFPEYFQPTIHFPLHNEKCKCAYVALYIYDEIKGYNIQKSISNVARFTHAPLRTSCCSTIKFGSWTIWEPENTSSCYMLAAGIKKTLF